MRGVAYRVGSIRQRLHQISGSVKEARPRSTSTSTTLQLDEDQTRRYVIVRRPDWRNTSDESQAIGFEALWRKKPSKPVRGKQVLDQGRRDYLRALSIPRILLLVCFFFSSRTSDNNVDGSPGHGNDLRFQLFLFYCRKKITGNGPPPLHHRAPTDPVERRRTAR